MWVLALALIGCSQPEPEYAPPPVLEGAPIAGAAEGTLDLPVGTPLGGYSARCSCLSGQSRQDGRDSAYSTSFVESTGIHTRAQIKVVWLGNGDDALVLIHTDVIYANDNIIAKVTEQLEAATGEELSGRVVLSTNHSHHSYGPFADQGHFYLGGDLYNSEIFARYVHDVVEVALEAHESREPVAIGTSWAVDWDPNDTVYRDRRGENNDLPMWDDIEHNGKDPHLNMLRIDRLDGSPMAAVFTFGVHGITISERNSLVSGDTPAAIEMAFQESFDEPVVVMHLQGAGGDASPAGTDREYAKTENVGEKARPLIYELWEDTPTSADPIRMETASRHIWQFPEEIKVTRNGTVDLYYPPQIPVEDADPDDIIYNEDGSIASPLDEFNAPNGAAFCGNGDFQIPLGSIGSDAAPYAACIDVGVMSVLVHSFFDLEPETLELPFKETLKAGTTVSRFGPIPTRLPDGTVETRDVFGGFFPGEVTAMYAEQWRRRVSAELGHPLAWTVGYAQDHEGYLLIPEDWLVGGYEPNISLWGPLQGEYIMENMLQYGDEVLNTDVREDPDPWGTYGPTEYDDVPLPTEQPDLTPNAGTRLEVLPEYFWAAAEIEPSLETPEQLPRLTGIAQVLWEGGDPAVDLPRVVLERLEGEDWVEVTSHSGRPITDSFTDILTGHTPDPLFPSSAEQTHYWWAGWQAVGHDGSRVSLPLGTYRLSVSGHRYTGGADHWPWPSEAYTVHGDAFELVAAPIQLEATADGYWAWFDGPANGYRMIDVAGDSRGRNPVRTTLTFDITTATGTESVTVEAVEVANGRSRFVVDTALALSVEVSDPAGNEGAIGL